LVRDRRAAPAFLIQSGGTMTKIAEAKIAILATHGYERSELREPLSALRDRGAEVHVVSPEEGEIKSWDNTDWGDSVRVDRTLKLASPAAYDALVLPGGQINPDVLRANPEAVAFVRAFFEAGKTLAAICHGPWLLIEAGAVKGRDVTSYHSIRTDMINAGGHWRDEEVVVDNGIVTSRRPDDLPAFIAKIVEEIEEGEHRRAFGDSAGRETDGVSAGP
jgi:protease I